MLTVRLECPVDPMNGDQRKLFKQCKEQGCRVELVPSGYYKVWLPGERRFVRVSATPSSQNWLRAAKGDLRRMGLDL